MKCKRGPEAQAVETAAALYEVLSMEEGYERSDFPDVDCSVPGTGGGRGRDRDTTRQILAWARVVEDVAATIVRGGRIAW
jgi:hypothetical protein